MTQLGIQPSPTLANAYVSHLDGWTLHLVDSVPSTNPLAGKHLAAWHALRARTQTASYGRTGRNWTSDAGGLWLSANLPCPASTPAERARWSILPLAAGWAVIEALCALGFGATAPGALDTLRLRWPNDIMTGSRKLAGLLVERFTPETVTVGIGLNLTNMPEHADPALVGATARLAELLPGAAEDKDLIAPERIQRLLLAALRRSHSILLEQGFAPIAESLNLVWSRHPRRVRITLAASLGGATSEGWFRGVDEAGRVCLALDGESAPCHYDAIQIELLREQPDTTRQC